MITRGTRVKLKSGEIGTVQEMCLSLNDGSISFIVQVPPCDNDPCTCDTPGDSFHDDGLRDVNPDDLEVLE
jgi:hypothetical protein